ncbi:MAG TPA: thiamine phosphate synthase, partial [Elusimicrobiota bacterium]|nr:thiamine phosphate synthase [Elusimicrobiota bacterium]
PDYVPVGLDLVKEYRALLRIPFVAIGGIDETNVAAVAAAGADRVAVVRAVCGSDRPEEAARRLKEKIIGQREGART